MPSSACAEDSTATEIGTFWMTSQDVQNPEWHGAQLYRDSLPACERVSEIQGAKEDPSAWCNGRAVEAAPANGLN